MAATTAAPKEADYGVETFATTTPGIGGFMKRRIEDFSVTETGPPPAEVPTGRRTAAWIRLANWETNRFVREASHALGISRRGIQFAGNKDKRAVTKQWFTIRAPPGQVEELSRLPGVDVEQAYSTDKERQLGDHQGNRFRIVVRGIDLSPAEAQDRLDAVRQDLADAGGFPNFYGPQRFGSLRPNTHLVGRAIVHGRFQDAVEAYVTTPAEGDDERTAAARDYYASTRDARGAAKRFEGTGADFERALLNELGNDPARPERAFRAFPKTLQTLFVFAYQSFLYNRILSERIRQGVRFARPVVGDLVCPIEDGNPRTEWLPVADQNLARVETETGRGRLAVTGLLVGTEAPLAESEPGRIEREVLRDEGVEPRDFIVPEALHMSSKGTRRPLAVAVPPIEAHAEPDDLADNRTKVTLAFDLPKGVYATVLLREFLKLDLVRDYG